MPDVRIYCIDDGRFAWWYWLCRRHLLRRIHHPARSWDGQYSVKESKDAPHGLPCDDRALFECGDEMRP